MRQRIVLRLKSLFSWRASGGWLLLVIKVLNTAQLLEFVGRLFGVSGAGILQALQDWGWIAGLVWLFFLVIRPGDEKEITEEKERDRAFTALPHLLMRLIRRFEKFCIAYESGGAKKAAFERLSLDLALEELWRTLERTTPKAERWRYKIALFEVLQLHVGFIDEDDLSSVGRKLSPTKAIEGILEMHSRESSSSDSSPLPTKSG